MKMIMNSSCSILIFFLFAFQGLHTCISPEGEIQSRLDQLVADNGIPGVNFSVIWPDGRQSNFSSGYADTLTREKLNDNHILFSGSIGKTYAVALLMQLLEEGKVDLKRHVLEYFPDTDWILCIPNIKEITVEMLLQHTSGLPRYIDAQAVWDSLYNNPDKIWSYEERLSFTFEMGPVHEPGKGWAYSDSNYLLIGMLIEKITDENYYDLTSERILVPGGLSETYPSTRRDLPNLPSGYSHLPPFFRMPGIVVNEGRYKFNPQMEWTGGGFASSTPDLAVWAKLYYTGAFFSDSLLQKIVSPNLYGMKTGPGQAYGMGSFIYSTDLGQAYGHTGFVPGFNSIFAYFPNHEIAIAMQVNCDYAAEKISMVQYLEILMQNMVTFSK